MRENPIDKHNAQQSVDDPVDSFPLQSHTDTRPLVPLIIAMMVISLLTIAGIMLATFKSLDEQAQENLQERTRIALAVETKRQEATLLENSYWDEAHANLIQSVDTEWAEGNIGPYLLDSYGLNLSLAATANLEPTLAYVDGELAEISAADLFESQISGLAEQATVLQELPYISTGFRSFRGQPHLVSVGLFIDEESEVPKSDGSILIVARKIDEHYLNYIASTYQINGLRKAGSEALHENSQLMLFSGEEFPIVRLTWDRGTVVRDNFETLVMLVIAVMAVLMSLTWIVLRNHRLRQQQYTSQLMDIASKDFLTGISNRREFFFLANREMTRSKRDSSSLTALMLDIDHFKRVNDTLGHQVGDRVIGGFARLVSEHIRDFDVFARIGGEEFVVLLIGASQDKATEIAERLCRVVREQIFNGNTMEQVRCTVSIGLAAWDNSESVDKLLSRADDALYTAKRSGRDQVRVAEFS